MDVYKKFVFYDGFKDDVSFEIESKNKLLFKKNEKVYDFLGLILANDKLDTIEEEFDTFIEMINQINGAILDDITFSCLGDALENMRKYFGSERKREEYHKVFSEVFGIKEDCFIKTLEGLELKNHERNGDRITRDVPSNIINSIPKIASLTYIYALKYTGKSLDSSANTYFQVFKKRELPLLVKSKNISSLDKYDQILLEFEAYLKITNSDKNNYPSLNLYLLNKYTNILDWYITSLSIKSTSAYTLDLYNKTNLEAYYEKSLPLINSEGFYLKFFLNNEIDYHNKYIQDEEFWRLYKILFEDIKNAFKELFEYEMDKRFKRIIKKVPAEIQLDYVIYYWCKNVESKNIRSILKYFNSSDIRSEFESNIMNTALKINHDLIAKMRNSYVKPKNQIKLKPVTKADSLFYKLASKKIRKDIRNSNESSYFK